MQSCLYQTAEWHLPAPCCLPVKQGCTPVWPGSHPVRQSLRACIYFSLQYFLLLLSPAYIFLCMYCTIFFLYVVAADLRCSLGCCQNVLHLMFASCTFPVFLLLICTGSLVRTPLRLCISFIPLYKRSF